MPSNAEIAKMLRKMAEVRRLEGASSFQVGAYTKAARAVESHTSPVEELDEKGLRAIPGIGSSISGKIMELCYEGQVAQLQVAEQFFAMDVIEDLMRVPGIGAKKAQALIDQGIRSRTELRTALETGKIVNQRYLDALDFSDKEQERVPLAIGIAVGQPIVDALRALGPDVVVRVEMAGSIRRQRETIKDIDIVCEPGLGKARCVIDRFMGFGTEVIRGDNKASIFASVDEHKLRVDLLITDLWGASIHHFTGSKEHNVALRTLAKSRGLTISEFGIFKGDQRVGGENERDVYDLLGLQWHPPELREGGILQFNADQLVQRSWLKADLHMHTIYSDGQGTVFEMAREAKRLGLEIAGISDHIAKGMIGFKLHNDPVYMAQRTSEIRAAEDEVGVKLLVGTEVDIDSQGNLELPEAYLKELDYVMASIHSQPSKDVEQRLLKAISSGRVHVIGHATGRAYGKRPAAQVDWDRVFREAARRGVAFEINGQPDRLDPEPELVRRGIELGVRFVPCSDAHSVEQMDRCQGNAAVVARRAGLERSHAVLGLADVMRLVGK